MFISFISFHFNIIAHMFLYCGLYCFSKFQPSADGFSSPRLKAGASKPLFGEGEYSHTLHTNPQTPRRYIHIHRRAYAHLDHYIE